MSEPLEEGVYPLIRTRHMEEVPARLRATHPGYVQRIALSHLVRVLQRPGTLPPSARLSRGLCDGGNGYCRGLACGSG